MYSFNPFAQPDTASAITGGTFVTFKTPKGRRWLAFSSNNYEDRDKEIVSQKALEADVLRRKADGQYGPLRWWHVGEPDPTDAVAPWGQGIDLGSCDFSAMSGPFLVESGTFANDKIGNVIAAKADKLALSIGFFHPRGEPDADGVFHHIRQFERSLAPAGKVSNPLTALYVPGVDNMHEAQLKALTDLLGTVPEVEVKALIDKYTTSATKTATAAGLRYKALSPEQQAFADLEAQIATLKHAMEEKAPFAKGGEKPGDEADDEEPDEDEDDAEDYIGDLPVSQFKALMGECIKAALGDMGTEIKALNTRLDASSKLGSAIDEVKALFGGVAKKDASRADQIAQLQAQIAELRGDQPAAVVAASKSPRTALPTGATVPDALTVKTPDDKPAYRNPADSIGAWIEGLTG